MPVAPDIAEVLAHLAAAPEAPATGPMVAARRHHERDAVLGTPPADRPPVRTVESISVPGGDGDVRARVYRPFGSEAAAVPTVLWIHGGGWMTGSLDTADTAARTIADQVGAVVVTLDYRLAPEHPWPAGLEDVLAALSWVRHNAGLLGGDPARLAVGGDSAGGNLAAVAAQWARDEGLPLAAQLLVYPVADADLACEDYPSRVQNASGYYVGWADIEQCVRTYLGADADPADPRISPLRAENLAGVAPAVVVTVEYDTLRDEGDAYAAALRAAGVTVVHQRVAGLVHGAFDMLGGSATARAAMVRATAALRSLLGPVERGDRDAGARGADGRDAGVLETARYVARFQHPAKTLLLSRFPLSPGAERRLAAAVAGCDEGTYRRLVAELDREVRASAAAILDSPELSSRIAALPFRPGERVVALGDSITDDACSWAEQLRVVLELVGADVEVVNLGVTGATTHDQVARADLLAAARPDWVLQMLGTNDARRHGRVSRERMLSLRETVDNLGKLERLVTREAGARLVRMTPPPVVAAKVERWQPFRDEEITWVADEVRDVALAVLRADPSAVDVHAVLSGSPGYEDLFPDGVHPDVAGQRIILGELVRVLTEVDVPAEG